MYVTWFSNGLQTNCKTCVRSFFLHTYTHYIYCMYSISHFPLHPYVRTYVPSGQECCLLCPPDLCSLSTLQSVSERSKAPGVLEREESSTTERSASSGTTKSCSLSGGVIRQCKAYSSSDKNARTLWEAIVQIWSCMKSCSALLQYSRLLWDTLAVTTANISTYNSQ